MSGAAHLRIVVALLVVGGLSSLAPYVAALFVDDVAPYSPFSWTGGLLIPLAAWLARGSPIARNLLIMVSIIGVVFWSYVTFAALKYSASVAAVVGVFAVISAYCLWALMFSKDVRAELARRSAD